MAGECEVNVSRWDGQQLHIEATAVVHGVSPETLFDAVAGPDASSAFRNVQAVQNRRVLHDDGVTSKVEQVQVQRVGFLMFQHHMRNKLLLDMDKSKHQVSFKLLEPGMMKDFQGSWKMTPTCCDHANDLRSALQQLNHENAQQAHLPLERCGSNGAAAGCKQPCTIVSLKQTVKPAFMPPFFGRIAQGMAAKEARELMEDLAKAGAKAGAIAA